MSIQWDWRFFCFGHGDVNGWGRGIDNVLGVGWRRTWVVLGGRRGSLWWTWRLDLGWGLGFTLVFGFDPLGFWW